MKCLLWQPISHPAVRLSECSACFLISTFFLQTEKQTSVLFICGWEAFKDYFADLVLTRLPRKKHKSPRHTPMWATFLTFQKVLKSVWAWGPPLNVQNIGCFLGKSSPLERKLFLGAIFSSCQGTHRTLVFSKKR